MGAPAKSGKPKNHVKHLISGGLTGAIEACITYPTEFIKTKMQLYPEFSKKGLVYSFKETIDKNGVRGLYRGLSVLVTMSAPKTGLRFYSKSYYQDNFFSEVTRVSTVLSGLGAGVTEAIFVVTPGETIKTKLIHDKISEQNKYKGLIHGTRTIIKDANGFSGVYKGLGPTILRQGSNQATRFFVHGEAKAYLINYMPETAATFIGGGIAGAASVYGTKSPLI